ALFPQGLESIAEFHRSPRTVRAPLLATMPEFGSGPFLSARQLAAMGYRMVISPLTALRVSMKAAEDCLRDLKRRGTQRASLDRMLSRQQLYDLLGYDPPK